jgi:hypothetical protein
MLYKALGYVVWRVAKRYLRRRLPARRKVLLGLLGLGLAGAAAAVVARRDELLG